MSLHDDWMKTVDLAIIFDVGDYSRIRDVKTTLENFSISNNEYRSSPPPH